MLEQTHSSFYHKIIAISASTSYVAVNRNKRAEGGKMHSLSDCFAFLSELDVSTLDLVIREAARILGERQRRMSPSKPGE